MSDTMTTANHGDTVAAYFAHIRELRAGVDGAVERLLELWDDDGTFEFAGTPPLTGTFVGRNAIAALYENRFNSSGMRLRIEGEPGDADLGLVDTEVTRTRVRDSKVIAAWNTTIGTADQRGFQVAGSHTFTFKGDKIAGLRVVVSPRPDAVPDLRLDGLSVEDIGLLSLAAWMVV
ncbi:MAG: nuclear transport factor 2 family protein [Acidimicrobiia bacterium]